MGMATAFALISFDRNLTIGGFTICKINDVTPVGTMWDEIAFGMTEGTFLYVVGIGIHKRRK